MALAGLTPPQGARIYAYAALADYESWQKPVGRPFSLASKLNGAPRLPNAVPGVDQAVVVATAYATVANGLFTFSGARSRLNALLADHIGRRRRAGVMISTVSRSTSFAIDLSEELLSWARTDGRAEASDRPYMPPPKGPASWVTTFPLFNPPTDPFAGTVRTFLLSSASEVAIPDPSPFSIRPASPLYQQAERVRQAHQALTDHQRDIAFFWADATGRSIGATPGPAGHWLYNSCSIERQYSLSPLRGAQLRACVTVAMHDALTCCWHHKYRYNLLRPETYIQRHIRPDWAPTLMTPSFPEYPSGHSMLSHAAARIVSAFIGHSPFTDETRTHLGFPATRYLSPTDAADAASISRLYGGIHYPLSLTIGATAAREIGEIVARRLNLT